MEEPKIQRKSRLSWLLGAVVLLLLATLILLQSSNLWKTFSVETAEDTLAFYALSSLNFIAFVIFAFIFVRNIIKLIRERRTFQIGSKIKTRLLLYFVAVSLLPIIAMAVFSYLFMNRALERWFTQIPENVVRLPLEVQNQADEDRQTKLVETARMLVTVFETENLTAARLDKIANEGNLTRISILASDGRILLESERALPVEQKIELDSTLSVIRRREFDNPILRDGQNFDAVWAFFSDGRILVIVPEIFSGKNVSQVVENSLAEFDKLKDRQVTVRQIGFSTLGLLTFLLIFASSWTAFYIARGLTVPIKALAEAADELARGNYNYRVEVLAEDELATLVAAFNQMSGRLEANSVELEERRRYTETILQSLPTGVISFDAANLVTTINKAAVAMLKLEDGDFRDFPLEKLVGVENCAILERLLNRAKRIGQAGEQTSLQRDSTESNQHSEDALPVALTATALPDKNGVVLVIEDLTELLQAQRASAWSEVARRMAHEIKNPLTPIQLSAERIAKRFKLINSETAASGAIQNSLFIASDPSKTLNENSDSKQTQKIITDGTETILREVSGLKAMVDEFSRFARLPNVRLETGDLNDIMRQSTALFEDREVRLETDLAENLPPVLLDEEQLRRVFVNLIENAVEAFDGAQENKEIRLKTFYERGRDLLVAEISDNGNGIPPADFKRLFQPYFSTKGRGTGLGLAIVQRIVIEHGGKIKAVNNSPKGAKFIIELPISN